ncbi:hypothetical protein ACA910_021699 [Epithemia clementina (nom. ined.)]
MANTDGLLLDSRAASPVVQYPPSVNFPTSSHVKSKNNHDSGHHQPMTENPHLIALTEFPHGSLNASEANLKRFSRKRSRGQNRKGLTIAPDPNLSYSDCSDYNPGGYDPSTPDRSFWVWKFGPDNDGPDTSHLPALIATLMLTNALGVMSGLDAKHACLKHETNLLLALREGNDDGAAAAAAAAVDDNIIDYEDMVAYEDAYDEAFLQEAKNGCIRLFRRVLLPAMLVTQISGFIGLVFLRYLSRPSPRTPGPPEALNLCLGLLVAATVIFAAQAYNVTYIMLSPRRTPNSSENPFHSLGAVDLLGHVSDNANLYYHTWLSGGTAIALLYQTLTATMRAHQAVQMFKRNSALLPATSWFILSSSEDHESRHAWYQSVYKLRVRTGIWMAAFLTSLVITASSQYIWKEVLWPHFSADVDDDGDNGKQKDSMESLRGLHFSVCQTIFVNSEEAIPVTMCRRTAMAWLAGVLAMVLCVVAIGTHWIARIVQNTASQLHSPSGVFRNLIERHRLPLGAELVLSMIVSVLLGCNAVMATGLLGPATNVGNLYYASWLAFLLLIRICLGCVEEWCQVESGKDNLAPQAESKAKRHPPKTYQAPALDRGPRGEVEAADISPNPSTEKDGSECTETTSQSRLVDETEKDRVERLRSHFCLSIFSTICAASAQDAAANEQDPLNSTQKFILLAPKVVAIISLVLFILCLSRRCYLVASHFCVGGVLAVISFGLWLADLVLTMHSEESWAVNRIGEIKMANLYYFSWASILTAGLHLMTFVKALFSMSKNDTMSIVWIGICKVCFVIFGAAMHIWLNISNKCDIAEFMGAVTFCSRTVLAIIVSLTGMLVGIVVIVIRFFQKISKSCRCDRFQAHIEIILSSFLLLLFAAAVALITGIGGPGQSVGDLYYSTWLSFAVALAIFLHCYDQITQAEDKSTQSAAIMIRRSGSSGDDSGGVMV